MFEIITNKYLNFMLKVIWLNISQTQRLHLTSFFFKGYSCFIDFTDFIVCNLFQLIHIYKVYTKWNEAITNSVLNQTNVQRLKKINLKEGERKIERKREWVLTKGKINFFFHPDTECDPGYLGQNCPEICRYPTYREECQKMCECNEKHCDIVTGCFSPDGLLYF